jgi:hypothetical protein
MAKTIEGIKIAVLSSTLDFFTNVVDERGKKEAYDALMRMGQYEQAAKIYEQSTQQAAEATKTFTESMEEQIAVEERKNKLREDGLKLQLESRTDLEKYNDTIKGYNELLREGAIDSDTFNKASMKAWDDISKKIDAANTMTIKQSSYTSQLNKVAVDLGYSFQSAFEGAIIEGKRFHDVLLGLAQDIEKILLRKTITQPLADAISSMFAGGGLSYSQQVSRFGGGVNTYTPPTNVQNMTIRSAKGNVFSYVPFASGGVIDGPISFPMTGGKRGLAGEAGKEAILPLMRTSSGDLGVRSTGGTKTEINIYTPPGTEARQETQQDNGMERINIYIDEAVAGNINKPGSKTHRSLKNTFGLGQTLTKR